MTTEAELAATLEDYRVVLGMLAERARQCRAEFECRHSAEPGPGYEYEAGLVAGWENAAMMVQGLLLARAASHKCKRMKSHFRLALPRSERREHANRK